MIKNAKWRFLYLRNCIFLKIPTHRLLSAFYQCQLLIARKTTLESKDTSYNADNHNLYRSNVIISFTKNQAIVSNARSRIKYNYMKVVSNEIQLYEGGLE